jgi:hypothetical protein
MESYDFLWTQKEKAEAKVAAIRRQMQEANERQDERARQKRGRGE